MVANRIGSFSDTRIQDITREVMRRSKARKDYVISRSGLDVRSDEDADDKGSALALGFTNGSEHVMPLKRGALIQLATSLDVPSRFLDNLSERGHTDMLAGLLSELLSREAGSKRHLVRTMDDTIDAFLSDRYKAIGNEEVMVTALGELKALGAEVWDLRLSDNQFRLIATAPGLSGEVRHAHAGGGAHTWWERKGLADVHHAAVTIGNSETGHGSFFGKIATWRKVCSNLAVSEDGVARVHLGGKLKEGEQHADMIVSDATRKLEDATLVSKLADVIKSAFDPIRFRKILDALSATTARVVPEEVSASLMVDATIRLAGLPLERKEAILEEFLRSGDRTQYGLAQSVTAQANPEHAGSLDDDTRSNIEEAGGTILKLSDKDWRAFLGGALKPVAEVEAPLQTVRRTR